VSDIAGGQLWVSSEPRTYYVAKVHMGVAFVVPVRINGVGKDAQVIADGPVKRLTVSEILETWMPAGMPTKVPRTWHEQLLEGIEEKN
jgi:hypothetical protein